MFLNSTHHKTSVNISYILDTKYIKMNKWNLYFKMFTTCSIIYTKLTNLTLDWTARWHTSQLQTQKVLYKCTILTYLLTYGKEEDAVRLLHQQLQQATCLTCNCQTVSFARYDFDDNLHYETETKYALCVLCRLLYSKCS